MVYEDNQSCYDKGNMASPVYIYVLVVLHSVIIWHTYESFKTRTCIYNINSCVPGYVYGYGTACMITTVGILLKGVWL